MAENRRFSRKFLASFSVLKCLVYCSPYKMRLQGRRRKRGGGDSGVTAKTACRGSSAAKYSEAVRTACMCDLLVVDNLTWQRSIGSTLRTRKASGKAGAGGRACGRRGTGRAGEADCVEGGRARLGTALINHGGWKQGSGTCSAG